MRIKKPFTLISIAFAIFFWFLESIIHYFGYGEPAFEIIPADIDEIWMRFIIVILVVTVGILADRQNKADRQTVHRATLQDTYHILNNFLQMMLRIRDEAKDSEDVDDEVLARYDQIIEETTARIRDLDNISDLDRSAIEDR